jgi:hypothetical protein
VHQTSSYSGDGSWYQFSCVADSGNGAIDLA